MPYIKKIKKGSTTYDIQDAGNEARFSSDKLKIANGGTGAASASMARENLGVYSKIDIEAKLGIIDVSDQFTFEVAFGNTSNITNVSVYKIYKYGKIVMGRIDVTRGEVEANHAYAINFTTTSSGLSPILPGFTHTNMDDDFSTIAYMYPLTEYNQIAVEFKESRSGESIGSINFMYLCNG